MKLYRLETGTGTYWVTATNPTSAEEKYLKHVNKTDYGYTSNRKVNEIHIVATEAEDLRFTTNHFLITKH